MGPTGGSARLFFSSQDSVFTCRGALSPNCLHSRHIDSPTLPRAAVGSLLITTRFWVLGFLGLGTVVSPVHTTHD